MRAVHVHAHAQTRGSCQEQTGKAGVRGGQLSVHSIAGVHTQSLNRRGAAEEARGNSCAR